MVERVTSRRRTPIDELSGYLKQALPQEYTVASAPVLNGCPFDLLVIGPSELFVLHIQEGRRPPQTERRRRALQSFLRDELPGHRVPVQHLVVASHVDMHDYAGNGRRSRGLPLPRAVEIIVASDPPREAMASWSTSLADLLLPRLAKQSLDLSRRAGEPFIFRAGLKAWSVAEAVQIMDRRREDAVYHLRNGSLEGWLSEQGAEPLAEAARAALKRHGGDSQMALEAFLLDTGLVERPRLVVEPDRVDLGYVLVGEKSACHLRIQKEKGRSYLSGTIRSPHMWLRVSPDTFAGDSLDAVVRVDIESLAIRGEPYRTELEIVSNAGREPLSVPVRFQVMPLPSSLQRFVLRPLLGAAVAGTLGTGPALLLWLLAPAWAGAAAVWAVAVVVIWGLCGVLLGLRQPPAWPGHYALRRWSMRILRWMGVLFVVATVLAAGWRWLAADLGWAVPAVRPLFAGVVAAAAAVVPAVRAELRDQRLAEVAAVPVPRTPWEQVRPLVVMVALAVLLFLGARWAGGTWQRYAADGTVETVQVRVEDRWASLDERLNNVLNEVTIYYYERRNRESGSVVPERIQRWWRWLVYQ